MGNGQEKVSARANHRLFKGSIDFVGQGQHDWPGLSEDRHYGADLLPMAARLWQFECGSGQAIEGDGKGECPIEAAGG